MSPTAFKAAVPAIVSGPLSAIPPVVEVAASEAAVIDGSVMALVEVSDTAANGCVAPNAAPKTKAPAVAVRSTGGAVNSHERQMLSTAPPKVVVAVPELRATLASSWRALLNVIGPLAVVTFPKSVALPATFRPASGVAAPTGAWNKTVPPMAV